MNWQDEYKRKLTTADEAINVVKAGDHVAFTVGIEPLALGMALLNRGIDVGSLTVYSPGPGRDFPWYEPGMEGIFHVEILYSLPRVQRLIDEKKCDYLPGPVLTHHRPGERKQTDVLLTQVSPPDEDGLCSFGASLWNKKEEVKAAKVVLAEVNNNFIRTHGDNFVHVSEIDWFVEHTPSGKLPGGTDMLGRKSTGPGECEKKIAENVAEVVRDGDCLEIGVGGTAEWLVNLGAFDSRRDLGWHSENTVPGIVRLARSGIVNGERKNIHKGKLVATACGGSSKEDMDFINGNPLFELFSVFHVLDPRTIATNDNVVAINSCLQLDLTGQIAAESLGHRMLSGTGGQLAFVMGANLSKGGRSITVLPSTARGGTVSRIVAALEVGTVVSVPRSLVDIIVTEYGVARLRGKTQRERAEELTNICHPDFRGDLKKMAQKLYYP